MKRIVFYSWQSDLPNGTNRTLVENALNEAAKEIGNETDIEPVIDRDTQGISGAPNIATAIFDKIKSADIFVADVSIIGSVKRRAIPNPNVLIELGYALKALGHERIILVFNTAFGKVEKLPFDLRMHRTLTYNCAESVTDRSEIKKGLIKDFKLALTASFSHVTAVVPAISIIDKIKNNTPSKKIDLREYLSSVMDNLEKIEPKMMRDGGTVEDLLTAIPKTKSILLDFAKLSEAVVLMDDTDSANEIFQWFGKILTKYNPVSETGRIYNCDGDFYKFVGHDFFVSFVTPFFREKKWNILKDLLKEPLKVGPTEHQRNGAKMAWHELYGFSPLLADESKKRNRVSLHSDLLKEMHEKEDVSRVVPFKEFSVVDFFLHLHGEGKTQDEYHSRWYPISSIWLNQIPEFILDSTDYPTAMKICGALQINDIEEFKKRLGRLQIRWDWSSPFDNEDIQKIGSTGGAKIIN